MSFAALSPWGASVKNVAHPLAGRDVNAPRGRDGRGSEPKRGRHLAIWSGALVALWLALTTTLDVQELVAGALAAAVAAVTAELVRAQGLVRFRPMPRWLVRSRILPRRVLSDSVLLGRVLFRHALRREVASGAFRALGFDPGGDDARSATRRALVIAAISLTPNTIVVGIDRNERLILVHQLAPSRDASARDDIVGWL
jgi:multisubunit Na+/H+ antiporter MnhE subunit